MKLLLFFIFAYLALPLKAESVFQTPSEFIEKSLGQSVKPSVIWLDDKLKADIEAIMAHPLHKLRIRYWRHDQDTAWILEEVGKESPITVGVHIKGAQIENVKVLVYRESRGDEVRHAFFTDQFKNARLTDNLKLSQHIDGITGATLSVRALTKVSRLALYLNAHVQAQ